MILFPPPFPDELLYSILARYHVYSGNESCKKTMRDLFGSATVCAVTDLPCHLQKLSDRIPGRAIDATELLWKHTFFAYYAPFMNKERLKAIL
ncbi:MULTISPECIES: TniQ family protein [Paenibacillus]|uniref:TniQ family protein n=1 Tax=Paenibacillus TaxID=44249 RepID=UPI001BD17253